MITGTNYLNFNRIAPKYKTYPHIKKHLSEDQVCFSGSKNKEYKPETKRIMEKFLPKKINITQQEIDDVLRTMGTKFLNKKYKDNWTKEVPTAGYCYAVSEFVHYFVDSDTSEKVIVNEDGTTHWFLEKPDGKRIDFTRSQFGKQEPEYNKARKNAFLTNFPSKKACEIAVRMGIISRATANEIPKIAKKLRTAKSKQEEKAMLEKFKSFLSKN